MFIHRVRWHTHWIWWLTWILKKNVLIIILGTTYKEKRFKNNGTNFTGKKKTTMVQILQVKKKEICELNVQKTNKNTKYFLYLFISLKTMLK